MWQRRFGGDRRLIEKTVQVNGRSYTVIGIMPKDFDYPVPAELWVPLALTPAERAERAELNLEALGRLKPGVSVAQARAALGNFCKQLEQEYPKTNAGRVTTILELRKELYFYSLPLFLLLQAAAGFVLLLACANLANLMVARMIGRQREIAVRAALGASRARLPPLFICETLPLSVVAGAVAILASFWSARALRTSGSAAWAKRGACWGRNPVGGEVLGLGIFFAVGL